MADEALALALAEGQTIEGAARKAGVGRTTAHRRLHQPEFRQRVNEIRGEMLNRMVSSISNIGAGAVAILAQLTQATSDSIKLAAARTILEYSIRGNELVSVQERLAAIEIRLKKQEKHAR